MQPSISFHSVAVVVSFFCYFANVFCSCKLNPLKGNEQNNETIKDK